MKKFIITSIVTLLSVSALAQSVGFLNLPNDPKAMAMGGTSVAVEGNALSINPAAVAFSQNTFDVAANYMIWTPQSNNYIGLGTFYKFGDKFAVSLNGNYFTHQPYNITNDQGEIGDEFSPNEMSVDLGFSYRIINNLSIGIKARFINSSLSSAELVDGYKNGIAFGADIGVMYQIKGFGVSLMATNLGSKITYGADKYALPSAARLGLSYDLAMGEKHSLLAALDANYFFAGGFTAGIGLQYGFNDMVFIRGGYHYGDIKKTVPSYASVGVGVKFFGITLNGSYLIAGGDSPLNNTFNVSLGWGF